MSEHLELRNINWHFRCININRQLKPTLLYRRFTVL